MNIRSELEKKEYQLLSPYATKSDQSKGRAVYEEPCDIRTCFDRDRDRILHCKTFRRLKHKTQVFMDPVGDHYRTRMTHTLEVSQIARTIGKALSLNEGLIEAIALAHDLGHTPFGHIGERALNEVSPYGFKHNEQSLRVVDLLEKDGKGLNLTYEVRDGIINHKSSLIPATLEGKVVRLSDKIAYLHHDMDDAIRCKMICEDDVPEHLRLALGETSIKRLDKLIHNVIENSLDKNDIMMSSETESAMYEFRKFMFKSVYRTGDAVAEEERAQGLIIKLYEHFNKNIDELPAIYKELINKGEPESKVVCDYISGMTDNYAIAKFEKIYVPRVFEKE